MHDDSSSIGSLVTKFMRDSLHMNYHFHDDCTYIFSLPIHNPLEKGGLFNLFDKDRLEGDLFCYSSNVIFDWRSQCGVCMEGLLFKGKNLLDL